MKTRRHSLLVALIARAIVVVVLSIHMLLLFGMLWLMVTKGGLFWLLLLIYGPLALFGKIILGPALGSVWQEAGAIKKTLVHFDDSLPFVLYLRSFLADGDSANPMQAGSYSSRNRDLDSSLTDDNDVTRDHMSIIMKSILYANRAPGATTQLASRVIGAAYEQQLSYATSRLGRFIAFENLGEIESLLPRLPSDPNGWEDWIRRLISRAQLVIIRPGESAGVKQELTIARGSCAPENLLLFFPVNGMGMREDNYHVLANVVKEQMGVEMPDQIPLWCCFVGFSPEWTPYTEPRNSFPPWLYGLGLTSESMRKLLCQRGRQVPKKPQLLPILVLPTQLAVGMAIILLFVGVLVIAIYRTVW